MTHCRYCNRFRLVRVSGSGPWLLDCGHVYLPLPSEAQRPVDPNWMEKE